MPNITRAEMESILKKAGLPMLEPAAKSAQSLKIVKTPDKMNDREFTRAIRDAIIAEQGAIKQYESIVDAAGDRPCAKVLTAIANEEKVHAGELQKILTVMLPDEQGFIDKGINEAGDKLKE